MIMCLAYDERLPATWYKKMVKIIIFFSKLKDRKKILFRPATFIAVLMLCLSGCGNEKSKQIIAESQPLESADGSKEIQNTPETQPEQEADANDEHEKAAANDDEHEKAAANDDEQGKAKELSETHIKKAMSISEKNPQKQDIKYDISGSIQENLQDASMKKVTAPVPGYENLFGKTALFCGDSIVSATMRDTKHLGWGYAGRIGEYYGLKEAKNVGVDGWMVSDYREDMMIIDQIEENPGNYDYVILEGGVNDAWEKVEVGQVLDKKAADCKPSDFNLSTFAGGLENELYQVKKLYPSARIGYVITARMNSSIGFLSDMSAYVDITKQACEKWGIPYLDLYNSTAFSAEFEPDIFTYDGIHPNSDGYEIYTRYVAEFMNGL